MKGKTTDLQTRLYLVAVLVLIVGLSGALLLYLRPSGGSETGMIQEFETSNRYRHDLEVYGGTMNVLADEFTRWFAGLWHGEKLAATIAFLTLAVSLGLAVVGFFCPADSTPAANDQNQHGSRHAG